MGATYQGFKQLFNPTNRQENDFTPNPNFLPIPNSMWSMKIEETFGNFCNSTNNPETLNWSCSDINTAWLDVKATLLEPSVSTVISSPSYSPFLPIPTLVSYSANVILWTSFMCA